MEWETVVNIPSGNDTKAGQVQIAGSFPRFHLRCTVPGCGLDFKSKMHYVAHQKAFAHGKGHALARAQRERK